MLSDKDILKEMYTEAQSLLTKRYPTGWGCAAVLRGENGQLFSSVYMETISCNVDLCFETGAICEAHKYDIRCTHSVSIVREERHINRIIKYRN